MVSLSRSKVERMYENLVQCYRKVNQLHEDIELDHSRDEVCEKYSNYKRQLPSNLLEKAADSLDGREAKIVFVGTDDFSKSLIINGFLSRPGFIPVNRGPNRIPLRICPVNFGKEERLEVIYRDVNEVSKSVSENEGLKNFLAPFKNQISENPMVLQSIFNDYVSAMGASANEANKEQSANNAEGAIAEQVVKTHDEVFEIANSFSRRISKLGGKYRENIDRKDEIISGETSVECIYAKEAYLYADNVFLKENKLTFIDLPATNLQENYSSSSAAILNEASCVVVILDVNQLAIKDQLDSFWKSVNSKALLDKSFFILNGFEKLLKEDLSSAFIGELIDKIKNKFGYDKLDMGRVIFSSSFRVALAGLMNQPTKTKDDEKTFEELVRSFHEKKQSLNPQLEIAKLEKLKAVYGDGGISQIRNSLLDFVSIELLFGRCSYAKDNLFQVSEMINFLIGPEKLKVKDFGGGSTDPIQKIFEPVTSTYEKVKSEFDAGFSDLDKVFAKLSTKMKNKILKAFKGVETKNWDELIAAKNLTDPNEIVQAILEKCKSDFANDFIQITLSEVKTLIKGRFFGTLERGLLQKKIKLMDEQLETNYTIDYDAFEQSFLSKINWAIESKPIELTWGLKKIAIKPKIGDVWTAEVAEQFKNDITTFFVNRYAKLTDDLLDCMTEYLNVYYEQFKAQLDKLMERMQSDILKNMEGKKEDKSQIYKKVRKHIKILGYVKNASEIDKLRLDLVGANN